MKKLLIITLLIGITFSCENFEGWNVDEIKPSEVPASYLLTSSQFDLARRMTDQSVNYNIYKLLAQQWTQTQYTDESNYDFVKRDIGGTMTIFLYRDVLNDLKEAKRILAEDEFISAQTRDTQTGIIEVMEVFTWTVLVDTYGNVPYTEALQGLDNLTPVYDDDAAIYADLFTRLDTGLALLNAGGDSFGAADLFFCGYVSQWKKLGNSLKLRMAVRTDDFDHARSATAAAAALSAGVFTAKADNFVFPFEETPPNNNPIWGSLVQSGRNDYVLANTFVDLILPLNDPRTPVYMQDNIATGYIGGTYGSGSSYVDFTHIGENWHSPDMEGVLMSYSEVQFLLAEAVERGLVGGSAENYYNAGVSASIIYWGGVQADADTYLAQASVAYTTAGATWKEVIGNQKYISLYGRGFEAWSSWRLLDYPNTMLRPEVSMEPVPRRYVYGNDDAQLNPDNYAAASTAMGGDKKSSRIFWDINGVGN